MSRPQSGGNDLDWLNPTTSDSLTMDETMLFGSFKDTFATDSTATDDLLFQNGLQLPLPGIESNTLLAPEENHQDATSALASPGTESARFTNPQSFFSQSSDGPSVFSDIPDMTLPAPAEMQHDAGDANKADLPNLSINTDVLAPQAPLPAAAMPAALTSAQPTPAWLNASTPFSALQSGKLNNSSALQVLTPKSSVSAHQTRNPLQLGPGWTETVQMANLLAADGSGQMFADISARIDRGFFLAENDWVCYRRNYFQVSSTFQIVYQANPGQQASRPSEVTVDVNGAPVQVRQFTVQLSSKNSHSDKKIELVQHTAKRDKGPQSVPCRKNILPGGDISSPAMSLATIATYERLQFRTATANNGKRRAHQQYYSLYLELIAQLATGEEMLIAKCESAPLVVRGRSPGHYAAHEKGQRQQDGLSPILSGYPETPLTGYMPMADHMSPYSPISAFPHSASLMMHDLSLQSAQPAQQPQQMAFTLDKQLEELQQTSSSDGFFGLDLMAPVMPSNGGDRE